MCSQPLEHFMVPSSSVPHISALLSCSQLQHVQDPSGIRCRLLLGGRDSASESESDLPHDYVSKST